MVGYLTLVLSVDMFMVGWVDLFIIGCVNIFNVGWVDVYVVGSVVCLRPSELSCSWSSELTGIFRSGWLTSLWLGGLTWVRWFLIPPVNWFAYGRGR